MSHILIAGKDWQARALLRAQLMEEGFEVEAYETIPEALATLARRTNLADLFIADVSASDEPSADVEALTAWSRKIPIWIIASRTYIVEKGLRGHGFEMTFLRPVDVGELVEQIKQRLEKTRKLTETMNCADFTAGESVSSGQSEDSVRQAAGCCCVRQCRFPNPKPDRRREFPPRGGPERGPPAIPGQ